MARMKLNIARLVCVLAIGFMALVMLSSNAGDLEQLTSLMTQHTSSIQRLMSSNDAGQQQQPASRDEPVNIPAAMAESDEEREPMIKTRERFKLTFTMGGGMFDANGSYAHLEHTMASSLCHSFSPYVEREAARRFLDPARDNIYFANSPAVEWWHRQLVLVSRIWLDRERYEPKKDWPANHFADNWLYTQRFSEILRPTTNGSILGLPSPKQWWVGDGPIEPRLFTVGGRLLISFNAAMAVGHEDGQDLTILWDYDKNVPIIPRIRGGTPMVAAAEKDDMPRDKHWSAVVIGNDQLYFVHNIDPLRVLRCSLDDDDGDCHFVQEEKLNNGKGPAFSDTFVHLRGGTPYKLYRWPYYVGVAHCTMYKKRGWRRFYTAHLVVIRVVPTFRVVYVSDDIRVHKEVYALAPMVRARYIDDGFIFPVSILVPNDDVIDIGVHVNDFSSVIIRLRGMKPVMDDVIAKDAQRQPERGPPAGTVQTYIHGALEQLYKIKFIHHLPPVFGKE